MTNDIRRQHEVLDLLASRIGKLVGRHEVVTPLWFASRFLEKAPDKILVSPVARALLALNTLTELGLPDFFALLITHLHPNGPLTDWAYRWKAEEDRHGDALTQYLVRLQGFSRPAFEKMRFQYLVKGFKPEWDKSPFRLIGYTVYQEAAAQMSHHNYPKLLSEEDQSGLAETCVHIGGDEARHDLFYTEVMRLAVEVEPENAICALAAALRSFTMPGKTIEGFADLEYLAMRSGLFDATQLGGIVEKTTKRLGLARLSEDSALSYVAKEALHYILKAPDRLRGAGKWGMRGQCRTVYSPLVPDVPLVV